MSGLKFYYYSYTHIDFKPIEFHNHIYNLLTKLNVTLWIMINWLLTVSKGDKHIRIDHECEGGIKESVLRSGCLPSDGNR